MTDLRVPSLKTVALSEPVWLDGAIHFAAESPARDEIHVMRARLTEVSPSVFHFHADLSLLTTLPGGPTDNGIRAMWPRMSQAGVGHGWTGSWVCGYQQGTLNAVRRIDWGTTFGPSYGIWPIGVANDPKVPEFAWDWLQAPPTTSQGVFGYLDGQWWTFDAIWHSSYALAYARGVLFHGWRNDAGVLHLLFKGRNETVLATDDGLEWHFYRVFSGHAEYPRGCSLPDGRVFVHAVDAHGQYRAALGPFPALDESETPMPKPTVTILPGWPAEVTLGQPVPVAVVATDAASIGVFLELDGIGPSAAPAPPGGLVYLKPDRVGEWRLRANAASADGQMDQTGTPRLVRVVEPPPPPPPQVVTEAEDAAAIALSIRMVELSGEPRAYYNARLAGLAHAEAMVAYRDALADAIRSLEV